jgi:hypothetical protein
VEGNGAVAAVAGLEVDFYVVEELHMISLLSWEDKMVKIWLAGR